MRQLRYLHTPNPVVSGSGYCLPYFVQGGGRDLCARVLRSVHLCACGGGSLLKLLQQQFTRPPPSPAIYPQLFTILYSQ